jgi:hypothetical protein
LPGGRAFQIAEMPLPVLRDDGLPRFVPQSEFENSIRKQMRMTS